MSRLIATDTSRGRPKAILALVGRSSRGCMPRPWHGCKQKSWSCGRIKPQEPYASGKERVSWPHTKPDVEWAVASLFLISIILTVYHFYQ